MDQKTLFIVLAIGAACLLFGGKMMGFATRTGGCSICTDLEPPQSYLRSKAGR